jgi:hypothetical protein
MDPLTCLSLAGTVIQFVDFGSKLIREGRQLYEDGQLKLHEQASAASKDLLNLSTKLQRTLRQEDLDVCLTEEEETLHTLCRDCNCVAEKLIVKLSRFKTSDDDKHRGLKSIRQAFLSVWGKKELKDTELQLEKFRQRIDSRVLASLR